jgi:DNA modification methylase
MNQPAITTRQHGYCRRSAPAWASIPRNSIILGDALTELRKLPSSSVDTVITSPAYYRLRNYAIEGQMGMEPTILDWVNNLVSVCDELARVLRPSGSLWLNLGDSFSRHVRFGTRPKSLLLGPERLLIALSDRGWVVRNKAVWSKPNPMPSSVQDRLNTTWEPVYLLVRSPRAFFDLDAIREPHKSTRTPLRSPSGPLKYAGTKRPEWAGPLAGSNSGLIQARLDGRSGHPLGKNPGDVWTIPTANFAGPHWATYPVALLERPIKATCPERMCSSCGRAWRRHDGTLRPDCRCKAAWKRGVVLDCFMGSGTTAIAAERLGRDWLGIEISSGYRKLALERIALERDKRVAEENGRRAT